MVRSTNNKGMKEKISPVLSVCIPTYNRPTFLKENIEVLAKQLESRNDIVEFIISDNCSEDNTREVIDGLRRDYNLNLTYYYQEEPLYFEDNFDFVADRAAGKYIYLMGDDDIVSPDFITIMFRLFNEGYELVHFNKLIGDAYCTNNSLFHKDFKGLEQGFNAEQFIRELLWRPNFMSSIIFSRRIWNAGKGTGLDKMYGFRFLGRVYIGAVKLNSRCCYYYFPILLMRNPQRVWTVGYPLYWFVGMSSIFKALDKMIPGVYETWIAYIHNKRQFHFVQSLSAVHLDKELYRKKRNEFMPYLNKLQKFTYDFQLSPFSCKLTRGLYYYILKKIYKE